jgi:3-oxoacyl-[acyl-carrier-protein] synthase II
VNRATPVWITGVGAATPLGCSYDAVADGLLNGRSAVRQVTRFDVTTHPSQIAAMIDQIPCPPDCDPATWQNRHRLDQVLTWCCTAALRDAGWWDKRESVRVGVCLGIGAEWLIVWEADGLAGGTRAASPHQDVDGLLQATCRQLHLSGPSVNVSAACASGNYALAQARHWLELGWCDVCLAGACDMAMSPMSLAGFGNLRALSRRNADPAAASRPFDQNRDGFVMGEGGTVFVLEPAATARKRGARAYAEVAGCGASSDAHHMVIPSPDPAPAVAAMRRALADAAVDPSDIDYVNAHATGTPVGDVGESRVLHDVFGAHVGRVPVSSTKSMTGHLLTAAAAFEALACLVSMSHKAVPPTVNLDDTDPQCNLCHVPHSAQERKVKIAASNSFGFGGSNTCLVLRAVA